VTREHPHLWDVVTYVRWAVEHSDLLPADRTLAVAVATHYNHEDGYARPSWPGLMRTYGYPRRTLARKMAAITAAGIWLPDTHPRRATRYRFPIGPNAVHRGATSGTPQLSTPVPPMAPQGCHQWHPNQEPEPGMDTCTDAVPRGGDICLKDFRLRVTVDAVPDDAPWTDYA
jgi:hypothetical protein